VTPIDDQAPRWAADSILEAGAVVLPVQYHTRPEPLRPEMRLMLAVLEDAVMTVVRHKRGRAIGHRRALREVLDWIASDDAASPFAFVRICDSVGLDAAYLRAGLTRLTSARTPVLRAAFRRSAGARHAIGAR